MGKMACALREIAGLTMILAALAAGFSFSDAMDSLGRPEGERLLGAAPAHFLRLLSDRVSVRRRSVGAHRHLAAD